MLRYKRPWPIRTCAHGLPSLGRSIFPREQQTPEGLAAHQKAEIEKWWPIIKDGEYQGRVTERDRRSICSSIPPKPTTYRMVVDFSESSGAVSKRGSRIRKGGGGGVPGPRLIFTGVLPSGRRMRPAGI